MQIKSFFRQYWKSISIIIVILYLSFASPVTFKKAPTFEYLDKIIHLLMYAGLTIVLIYDFRNHKNSNAYNFAFILVCFIFPGLLGGLIEIMQKEFFSPRTAEWGDWLSDIAGVMVGWLTMSLFGKWIKSV